MSWCGASNGNGKAIALRQPYTGNPRASWAEGRMVHDTTGRAINLWLLKASRHPVSRLPFPPAIPEHNWSDFTPTVGIRTVITTGAATPKPRPDILDRLKRKEAAA